MKIIISPAKKMIVNQDDFDVQGMPVYLDQSTEILQALRQLDYEQLKKLWHASEKLIQASYDQLQHIDLQHRLTPAILCFSGIQYQYMAPDLLSEDALKYLQSNLRILSGFYGVLKPFDGVAPIALIWILAWQFHQPKTCTNTGVIESTKRLSMMVQSSIWPPKSIPKRSPSF